MLTLIYLLMFCAVITLFAGYLAFWFWLSDGHLLGLLGAMSPFVIWLVWLIAQGDPLNIGRFFR